jgi:ketosteroid isomerase-like protein
VNTSASLEEQRVLAIDDEFVAAEVARDEESLRRLVDDSFRFNSSQGTTTDKEHLIQSVMKTHLISQCSTERSVLLEGRIALVFGTDELRAALPGQPDTTTKLRYTATYVNRQGQWRLLALQVQPHSQP